MRPACRAGAWQGSLDAFILRFAAREGIFRFPAVALVSQSQTRRGQCVAAQIERSVMQIRSFGGLALAGLFGSVALAATAAVFQENFASDPASRGWRALGYTNLFQWNAANGNLEVTWDSSRANSYFCLPLPDTVTEADDFGLSFDLQLNDFAAGINPAKPNPFQLALGFCNLAQATAPGFVRGSGFQSPNLVEFSFFPDPGPPWLWGPSLTATLIDWTATNWSFGGFAPAGLSTDSVYRVTLNYFASNRVLRATILRDGQPWMTVDDAVAGAGFLGFEVDHVGVMSYSDDGQDPYYSGSILAHGTLDNVVVTAPAAVSQCTGGLAGGQWEMTFQSRRNWLYQLERTVDFLSWSATGGPTAGNGGPLVLRDASPPAGAAFYRVKAWRP
jgi:hypothetical protein